MSENEARQAPGIGDAIEPTDTVTSTVAAAKARGLQPPEIIRAMTAEHRAELEKKLRRKIDLRLLPMIILMYILNYIDR
jgi:hypothetical protein